MGPGVDVVHPLRSASMAEPSLATLYNWVEGTTSGPRRPIDMRTVGPIGPAKTTKTQRVGDQTLVLLKSVNTSLIL